MAGIKPRGLAQWTQHEVEALIQSIARYTRFVRSTKVLLAVFALVLTGLVFLYPILRKDDAGIRVVFGGSVENTAPSPTQMKNARYHGLDKDNQPYNITAKTATQREQNIMDLDKVTGDIALKSGQWLSMSANTGVFYMKERLLDLKGSIEMFNDDGYEFRTETMHVDIAHKTAVTHDEVRGQGGMGTLKAYGGANIDGLHQTIFFEGPIFMTLYPQPDEKNVKKDPP